MINYHALFSDRYILFLISKLSKIEINNKIIIIIFIISPKTIIFFLFDVNSFYFFNI